MVAEQGASDVAIGWSEVVSKRISLGIGGPVVAVLFLVVFFVLSMRRKYRPVQDRVRQFARDFGNPRVMETAGQPGSIASVVRHVGRSSGQTYETPVELVETEDGFVIALPYGTNPDWLKNVLAAGYATIVHDGDEHQVNHPELVSATEGNHHFPQINQLTHRLFGVDDFLRLRRAGTV